MGVLYKDKPKEEKGLCGRFVFVFSTDRFVWAPKKFQEMLLGSSNGVVKVILLNLEFDPTF